MSRASRGDVACHQQQRVGLALVPVERGVDLLHETVKMDALLARERHAIEKTVHQEALAASDSAPQVNALHRALPAKQPDQRRFAPLESGQILLKPFEMPQCARLGGVEFETAFARRDAESSVSMSLSRAGAVGP